MLAERRGTNPLASCLKNGIANRWTDRTDRRLADLVEARLVGKTSEVNMDRARHIGHSNHRVFIVWSRSSLPTGRLFRPGGLYQRCRLRDRWRHDTNGGLDGLPLNDLLFGVSAAPTPNHSDACSALATTASTTSAKATTTRHRLIVRNAIFWYYGP
jgi:hypothetical protein